MSEMRAATRHGQARFRWSVRSMGLASLLALPACASLLGIEDISESAAAGAAGTLGTAGNDSNGGSDQEAGAGQMNFAGGSAMAGKGGVGHSGGSSGAGTQGGSGNAGAAAVGGSSGAGSSVHGHVIDFWRHPLANVSLEVGGKASTTDAQGAFSFDAVPDQYDASLVVIYKLYNRTRTRAWVYQGLTRRDPTLQIYEGLGERQTQLEVLPNDPSTLTGTRTLSISFGGPDGSTQETDVSGAGLGLAHLGWQGPEVTQETGHALIWQPDPTSGFPSQFIAFDSKSSITLTDTYNETTPQGTVSFDLSADTIPSGPITGTVPGSGSTSRFNNVFLRFKSNAVINLVADKPKADSFSYVVPNITDASAMLVAGDGDAFTEMGVVHKDGLLPNATGISLTIPTPPRDLLITPMTDADKVGAATQFSFKKGGSANAPFVAVFTYEDNSTHDDILYLVSAKAPFKLPQVVNGTYHLPSDGPCYWRVETHGAPESVDAMAGPTGFLDSLGNTDHHDQPSGPRTGDGSYTQSKSQKLQIAP